MKYETPHMGIIMFSDEDIATSNRLGSSDVSSGSNLGIGDFTPEESEVTE